MSKSKDNNFIKLLKKHTDIDDEFINTFFKKFKIGDELNFYIKDVDIAKYLGISLITLRKKKTCNLPKGSPHAPNWGTPRI